MPVRLLGELFSELVEAASRQFDATADRSRRVGPAIIQIDQRLKLRHPPVRVEPHVVDRFKVRPFDRRQVFGACEALGAKLELPLQTPQLNFLPVPVQLTAARIVGIVTQKKLDVFFGFQQRGNRFVGGQRGDPLVERVGRRGLEEIPHRQAHRDQTDDRSPGLWRDPQGTRRAALDPVEFLLGDGRETARRLPLVGRLHLVGHLRLGGGRKGRGGPCLGQIVGGRECMLHRLQLPGEDGRVGGPPLGVLFEYLADDRLQSGRTVRRVPADRIGLLELLHLQDFRKRFRSKKGLAGQQHVKHPAQTI